MCSVESLAAAAGLAADGHCGRQTAAGLTVAASSQGNQEQMVFRVRACSCLASGPPAPMNRCSSAARREHCKRAARRRPVKGEMFRRDIMSPSVLITISYTELTDTQT